MRALRKFLLRLVGWFAPARSERELSEELESHLELAVEDHVRSGLSEAEARRRALVELGGLESTKEYCRDASGIPALETVYRDVRDALRSMKRAPRFTFVVVFSLALVIGANAAIVQLAHALFLRALPVEAPGEVVAFFASQPELGDGTPLSFLNWRDIRDQSETLADVAGFEWTSLPIELERGTSRVPAQLVSGNYFDLLGVSAALGRTFSADARPVPGASLEAVLSHRFWQRHFRGDPDVVGSTLRIAGQPFTIVGVTRPEFTGVHVGLSVDLWVPLGVYRRIYSEDDWVWYEGRRAELLYGIARRADGASVDAVRAELDNVARRLVTAHPELHADHRFHVLPIAQATIFPWARPFARTGIVLLAAAVGLTLLIAVVNVANLFLVRARERRRDTAIRLALGVSHRGLARRVFVETLALSILAGAVGVSFLWLTQTALEQVIDAIPSPTAAPYHLSLALEPATLAIVFGLAVLLGLVLGAVPVGSAVRSGAWEASSVRAGRTESRRALFDSLLGVQLALSMVAVLGGSLFLRSLHQIRGFDPGFETHRLAFLRVDLSVSGASENATRERLQARVSALPGVESVGASPRRPMDGGWKRPMAPAEEATDPEARFFPYTDRVDGAFFDAMGLAVLDGRTFTRREELESSRVAILNDVLAERLWPGRPAVGRSLVLFDLEGESAFEVIGVVETSSYRRVTETPQDYVYLPLGVDHAGFLTLAIRTAAEPDAVLSRARDEVRAADPSIPILDTVAVGDVLRQSMWGPRLAATFLGVFAAIALLLSAVGIYGVISNDVERRMRELSIRVAVGASRIDVVGLVLRRTGRHYLVGFMLGLPLAIAASRWVSGLIFVDFLDVYAGLGGLVPLALIGLLASFLPARRAATVDPNSVLRAE